MDSDRRLWMWSDKTLYLCATKQSQARLFKIDQHIVSLDGRGDKVFLLSSKGTLFQANLRNESISKEVAVGFASDYTKLHLDMKGRLWIYDTYSSFTRCFSTVGRLKPLSLPSVIKSKCVKDIEDDGIGKIWIATNIKVYACLTQTTTILSLCMIQKTLFPFRVIMLMPFI